ncbi:hypothetical protein GE061_002164 [Apolygus lucorum]|uniref:Uncharacterized protein n=1 Tax=Apolygus lucorum TaxID=248454 RepID=A0A6A4J606_APOLU|nr:hypothetical protein GE061_002164 [Apolygus lucorum]
MCDHPQLTTNCFLNGKPYILQFAISKLSLSLTLTNKNTFEKWKSTPSVEYIESMTRKTGNFKTFSVFTDMMRAVFLNSSSSLSMKLLTHSELEKINDNTLQSSFPEGQVKKRVYFILVYTSEFDRIHYPLPMDYAGLPNPEILQATIHGLENDKCKLLKELEHCRGKNDSRNADFGSLKTSLVETAQQCADLGRKCQRVVEEFARLKERVEAEREIWRKELLQVKVDHERKMVRLQAEVDNVVGVLGPVLKMSSTTRQNVLGKMNQRASVSNQGDASNRWCRGRISDLSVDRPSRRPSPRRPGLCSGRPASPASSSAGSFRDSSSTLGRQPKKCSKLGTFLDKPTADVATSNFSDNDVNSVRIQIENLQRAVLGLTKNISTSNV